MDCNSQEKSRVDLYHEILEGRMLSDVAEELGCSRQNVHARFRKYLSKVNPDAYAELMSGDEHPPMYKLRINRSRFLKGTNDEITEQS